jgi:transcriptional regulator with XRE-family HTH domain
MQTLLHPIYWMTDVMSTNILDARDIMGQTNLEGKTLKELQEASGKKVRELCAELGIPPSTFNTWTSRQAVPSMSKGADLARALNVPLKVIYASIGISIDGIPDDCQPE